MPEQIQKIIDRVIEWWKKFNNKQRVLLISSVSVIILALVILGYVVTRPTMVDLVICEDDKQASQVNTLLSENGEIQYEVSSDGRTFKVRAEDEAAANYLLAENDIPAQGYSISNVTDGSFSTTEADKQKKYEVYLEQKFTSDLETFDNIEEAVVDITMPDNDGTILSSDKEGTAAVSLRLTKDISEEQAYGLALFVATELGNESTKGITILNMANSNVIYSGADAENSYSVIGTQLSNKQKQEEMIKQEVKEVLANSEIFSNIDVGMNLDMNFDNKEVAEHEYSVPDGMTQGPISSESIYEAESDSGISAIPGTDSNDDNGYMIEDGDGGNYSVSDRDTEYKVNEKITQTQSSGGVIQYDTSSISIMATRWITYDEDQLRESGELDDITFEEFKATHSELREVEVDESFIRMVANATGFPEENITFLCYEKPQFIETDTSGRSLSNIFQIVLAVLIFALLGYVVFRSTRKQQEMEMEEELSVEALLESTSEQHEALEDIGYAEKSETRLLIEKFVEENPDAVALLLRNWLNEDWE